MSIVKRVRALRTRDDEALLAATRDGDDDAFASLYERHLSVARGVARRIAGPAEVDDVVSEAFTRTLSALRSGSGPVSNMAGYVVTTVHRTWIDRQRRGSDIPVDRQDLEPALVEQDRTHQVIRAETLRGAFDELTPRWQEVLWLSEVEQMPHPEIARRMDLKPNAVAALAMRARRAFQDCYLQKQVAATTDPACAAIRALMPAHVNGRAGATEAGRVEAHVAGCPSCAACLADVRDARAHLGIVLLPLGALPVIQSLATTSVGAATLAGSGTTGWAGLLTGKVATVVAAATVTTVAGAAALAPRSGDERPSVVDVPRAMVTLSAPQPPRESPSVSAPPTPSVAPSPLPTAEPPASAPTQEPDAPELPEREVAPTPAPAPPPEPEPEPEPTPRPAPAPEPDPTPSPTPEPIHEPIPEPTPHAVNPRISDVIESDSPRGTGWRRLTIRPVEAQRGDGLRIEGPGGATYCARACLPVPAPGSWTAVWSWSIPPTQVEIDVLPERSVELAITLITRAQDDDPSDNTRSVTLRPASAL